MTAQRVITIYSQPVTWPLDPTGVQWKDLNVRASSAAPAKLGSRQEKVFHEMSWRATSTNNRCAVCRGCATPAWVPQKQMQPPDSRLCDLSYSGLSIVMLKSKKISLDNINAYGMFSFSKSARTLVCTKSDVLVRFQTHSCMACLSFEPSLYQEWINQSTI